MPFPSVLTDASWPAFSNTITVLTISSSDSLPPSTRACDECGDHVVTRALAPFPDQLVNVVLNSAAASFAARGLGADSRTRTS